ncbi:MAG TPA: ABC transporter substrate-binding protein [Stellaceae bacterium]|nr:ABC transporter substrate-binding protein [Stellaceae bacterium]
MISRRLPAALAAVMCVIFLGAAPAAAGEFTDSAGRIVVLPARINRVMAASPSAEVLVYVLAPDRLIGLTRPPPRGALPARYARLPVVGRLTGPAPTATAATMARLRPDLIIDAGMVTPERAAFADQITQATGVPYILLDNGFDRSATMLRTVGRILGVADRADDLAGSAEHAINALRGRLLIQPATQRPRVYYARGPSGLETGLPGSGAGAAIDAAGAINVAAALGSGERVRVTPQQLHEWNPDLIVVQDPGFYRAVQRNPAWLNLAAVRNKKVFLEPSEPFGWIDDPPGVNRLIGLYWLSQLFYPGDSQDDLRSLMADFYEKFYGIKLSDKQIEAIAKTAGIPPSDTPHLAALPPLSGPLPGLGAPGAVNEPGRRGLAPTPITPTTPSYDMPK